MSTENLMQEISRVSPDKYFFITKTAGEVRESPFRDEIVGQLDTIVKKAQAIGNPSLLNRFGGAAGGIAAVAATGIAYSLAGDMFDAVKRGISKTRNYGAMLRENPDLKDLPAKNVQKAFATLHRFNPEFAGDPTVAGSFVRRQAQFPEFDPKQLTDLIGARKNLADLKKLPIPSKVPWETHEEKALRAAQTHHFHASGEKATKELGYLEPTQKRMEAKEQREVERHPYQLAKDKQDVRHGGALAKQRMEMHPGQLERIQQQTGPEFRMKLEEHGRKGESHKEQMRSLRLENRELQRGAPQAQRAAATSAQNLNAIKSILELQGIQNPTDDEFQWAAEEAKKHRR